MKASVMMKSVGELVKEYGDVEVGIEDAEYGGTFIPIEDVVLQIAKRGKGLAQSDSDDLGERFLGIRMKRGR